MVVLKIFWYFLKLTFPRYDKRLKTLKQFSYTFYNYDFTGIATDINSDA